MRTTLIVAALALSATAACADAPITAADLEADGQLREQTVNSQQSIHATSEIPQAQTAEQLRVTGLVAPQADGPLEDATRFSLDSEAIYLHLRADGLDEPRPVTYVWIHADQRRETMGFLQPKDTISLAASLPLASFVETSKEAEIDPLTLSGAWEVEVYSTDAHGRSLVFEREFEVIEAEAFDAMLAAAALESLPEG